MRIPKNLWYEAGTSANLLFFLLKNFSQFSASFDREKTRNKNRKQTNLGTSRRDDYSRLRFAGSLALSNTIQRGRLLVSIAQAYVETLKVGEMEQLLEAVENAMKLRKQK